MVRDIERTLGEPIPRKTLDGFDYKAQPAAGAPEFRADRRPGGRPGGSGGGNRHDRRSAAAAPARRLTTGGGVCSHVGRGAEGTSRENRGTAARRPQR
jgi:hypothetical protein